MAARLPRGDSAAPLKRVFIVVCFLFAACHNHGNTGTVTGHLFAVGGPAPGLPRPLPGSVLVSGQDEFRVTVGSDGRYSVPVPEGTYEVSGRSPLYQGGHDVCHATSRVAVTTDSVSTADVFCQEM